MLIPWPGGNHRRNPGSFFHSDLIGFAKFSLAPDLKARFRALGRGWGWGEGEQLSYMCANQLKFYKAPPLQEKGAVESYIVGL